MTIAPVGPVASCVTDGNGLASETGSPSMMNGGGVVSLTMTSKVALPVLPDVSVAVQVTCVAPIANVLPDAGVQVGVIRPLTMSAADALKVTTLPAGLSASTAMSAGTVTTGAVESFTVTVKTAVPTLSFVNSCGLVPGIGNGGESEALQVSRRLADRESAARREVAGHIRGSAHVVRKRSPRKSTTSPSGLVAFQTVQAWRQIQRHDRRDIIEDHELGLHGL